MKTILSVSLRVNLTVQRVIPDDKMRDLQRKVQEGVAHSVSLNSEIQS
jgi:hypothetical protein